MARSGSARAERSEREQRLAAMRRAQQAEERRRRLLLVVGAGVLALALVATVVVTLVRQQRAQDPANIGLSASAAACQPEETVPVEGVAQHVGPGTEAPNADITTVEYDLVPAVSGQHYVQPQYPAEPFYTAEDRPAIETLVHNLEHGYTIAWYTSALPQEQVADLQAAAEAMRRLDVPQSGKFIAAPWDEDRGAFPGDAPLALAHWGAEDGALQFCGGVSGQVFEDFVTAHPASDSPEPNAA